jgi:hypothetical protein
MRTCRLPARSAVATLLLGFPLASTLGLWPVRADGPPDVVKVQEDWELVIGDADTLLEAPQVVCTMAPRPADDSVYSLFELNHQNLPSYQSGGLQLQVWSGEELLGYKDDERSALLGQAGEVITWTQEMSTQHCGLKFRVLNGNSGTWGEFAPDGALAVDGGQGADDLNGYSPDFSVSRSGVSYGAKRVQSFTLKRVRLYSAQGLIAEDDTPRSVQLAP